MPVKSKLREVCLAFFEKKEDNENLWKCRVCPNSSKSIKRSSKSGWSNLVSHLKRYHEDYTEVYEKLKNEGKEYATPSMFDFLDVKTTAYYQWLDWIVGENRELRIVEKKLSRKYSNIKRSVSTNTIKKYMFGVTKKVEENIQAILPEKFGIIFDGWEHESRNEEYLGCFAVIPNHKPILLFMQPFFIEEDPDDPDEVMFGAADYSDMLNTGLSTYARSIQSITFLVGDNCETNKSLATLLGVPLIGCASHRFNLAVQKYLRDYENILNKIESLFAKHNFG